MSKSIVRQTVQWAIISGLGLFFYFGHGIRFELTPWSQALVNVVTNFEYGKLGQIETTVLLYTEDDLKEFKSPYPVSYQKHADVLEELESYSPRAVFIDFAFVDEHTEEDVQILHDAICKLRRRMGNTEGKPEIPVFTIAPVLIAGQPPRKADPDKIVKKMIDLLECADKVGARVNDEEGLSGVLTYCGWQLNDLTESTPGVAMDEASPCLDASRKDAVPSAAYAMWKTLGNSTVLPREMELVWPIGSHPQNNFMCEPRPSIGRLVADIYKHGPHVAKRTCPYTRTLRIHHLLHTSGDKDVNTSLTGKTIFYGAAFALGSDVVKSPVFIDLPGVYLHATAYDNLVTYDGLVKRRAEGFLRWLTIGLLLLGAAVLVRNYAKRGGKSATYHEHERRLTATLFVLSLPIWAFVGLSLLALDFVQPEHLLFGCLLLYFFYRYLTDRLMAAISIFVYLYSCFLFLFFHITVRSFLEIILFFEVGNFVLERLYHAAEKNDIEKRKDHAYPRGTVLRAYSRFLDFFSRSKDLPNETARIGK